MHSWEDKESLQEQLENKGHSKGKGKFRKG